VLAVKDNGIGMNVEMDGYEVTHQLRTISGFARTILIAHYGYAGEEHARLSKQAGFNYHLVKPASIAQLKALIASA